MGFTTQHLHRSRPVYFTNGDNLAVSSRTMLLWSYTCTIKRDVQAADSATAAECSQQASVARLVSLSPL